jgi:50S ribosomal protein L16 3-hydroxylase
MAIEPTQPAGLDLRENAFCFSSDFSAHLARKYWEKLPVLIERPFAAPLIGPEEIFRAVLKASDQHLAGDDNVVLSFFTEHSQRIAEVGKFLPRAPDKTMAGYAKRIGRKLCGQRFALIIQDIHIYAPEVWLRFREFLRGLSQFIDIPAEKTKASVFIGDYEETPVGLHVGNSGNFKFVVEGRKRLRLWPDKFFRGKKGIHGSLDFERFLPAATTLEGRPGDVIYWPSDQWHIGEAVGGPAVSVSLALYVKERTSGLMDLWGEAAEVTEKRLAALVSKNDAGFDARAITQKVKRISQMQRRAAAAFTKAIARPEIGESLAVTWLNRATSFGFSKVPDPLPHRHLNDNAVIRAHPHYPIIWLAGRDDEVICSANGHAFSVAAHPEVLKLLRELNRGNALRVGALIKQYSGDAQVGRVTFKARSEDIRALLEKLYCLRAITKGARRAGSSRANSRL